MTAFVLRFLKELNLQHQRLLFKVRFSRPHSIRTVSRSRAGTQDSVFLMHVPGYLFDAQPGLGTAGLHDIQSLSHLFL